MPVFRPALRRACRIDAFADRSEEHGLLPILSGAHASEVGDVGAERRASCRSLAPTGWKGLQPDTGSGKTTLANALLAEPAFANDRVFLIEDTPELQCSAWDLVATLTRRHPAPIGVVDLVRDALRMRPDRIVVGEMREGSAALETLKAWNTGHPGGLSTIHANSAAGALSRLEDLLAEVGSPLATRVIANSVDVIVHIRREPQGRRTDPILEVTGVAGDGYRFDQLIEKRLCHCVTFRTFRWGNCRNTTERRPLPARG
ncbi:ATPase, T2SS/T4P/T4SS family [Brevundimonas sp. C43]|uniref:ATPase, T2SS/T4P/T4SS family n=1 Tax=Brevundimonas sp. C43 TaxID=3068314 RepID=UPI00273E07C5|nr:ATPase, T2SS/T4P/T4SS family [Brevundimonas sp. C43]